MPLPEYAMNELTRLEALAWSDISTMLSVLEQTKTTRDMENWVAVLCKRANDHKHKMHKYIDSIPEETGK